MELIRPETDGSFRQQAAKPKEIRRDTRKAIILFVEVFMIVIPLINLINNKAERSNLDPTILSSMKQKVLSRISYIQRKFLPWGRKLLKSGYAYDTICNS